MKKILLLAGALALLSISPVLAQLSNGNIHLTVTDANGDPLAGATVSLSGADYSRPQAADAKGKTRFSNLPPGPYDLTVSFVGFNTVVQKGLQVDYQATLDLNIKLERSEKVVEVVVIATTPLIDNRKLGTSTVFSKAEIEQIPTSRDPWAVLSTIPGVTTDRVNVAGSEAGQQAIYTGKGDDGAGSTWVMDGLDFTDIGAIGSTSSYLDFNSFDQIGFVTAGADIENVAPGVQLNFVTKQGSNRHTGTARLIYAEKQYQTTNSENLQHPPDVIAAGLSAPPTGNKVNENFEKNFDIGGPVWSDHIWYWFGFSQNDINIKVISGAADTTKLRNISGKVHGQIAGKTTWKLFYTEGNKHKDGRDAGINRPDETTWIQDGPTPIYSGIVDHVFTPNFEGSLQAGSVGGLFTLTPKGPFTEQIFRDSAGVYHHTFSKYEAIRPLDQFTARGDTYFSTGDWDHELKFGFRYKTGAVNSFSKYSTSDLIASKYYTSGYGGDGYVYLYRELNTKVSVDFYNAWVGDTVVKGPWTLSGGLHFSRANGKQNPSTSPANGAVPSLMSGVTFAGFDPGFTWTDISPRLGVTYTFNTPKKLLVRGSYGRYVDQLSSGIVSYNLPLTYVSSNYVWEDANGDDFFDGISEILDVAGPGGLGTPPDGIIDCNDSVDAFNIVACNTSSATSPNKIDRNLEAPYVDELALGAEYELLRDFSLAANLTFRQRKNTIWTPLYDLNQFAANGTLRTLGPAEIYDCSNTVSGSFPYGGPSYTEPYCQITPATVATGITDRDSRWETNNPGYKQKYSGLELTATKRLSNKWRMRAYIAYSDWTNEFSGTPVDPGLYGSVAGGRAGDPTNARGGTADNGGIVAVQSFGSGNKRNIFVGSSKWQFNVNGMYQLPHGMSISGNLYGRQGFGLAYFDSVSTSDGTKSLQIDRVDTRRYKDLWLLDLRFGKFFQMQGGTTVDVSVDMFNALNDNTVLQLDSRVDPGSSGLTTFNRIGEVLSPRIFRFGATISF